MKEWCISQHKLAVNFVSLFLIHFAIFVNLSLKMIVKCIKSRTTKKLTEHTKATAANVAVSTSSDFIML